MVCKIAVQISVEESQEVLGEGKSKRWEINMRIQHAILLNMPRRWGGGETLMSLTCR